VDNRDEGTILPGFAHVGLAQGKDKVAAHLALLALVLAVLFRTAWMSDDAEITLRCVMNFIHGYGPTFNIDERVQAFTHPLWFLLISAGTLTLGNVFAATFALSILLSLITWWLLMTRLATSFWPGIVAGATLILSKAFVDYSTSGLENPLSHFILVLGLILGFRLLESGGNRRSLTNCLGLLALIYLSRPDLVLLVFPFCLVLIWTSYRSLTETMAVIAAAIAPELAWTLFSLFYYGAPFPNTAYAKLGSGIPTAELTRQGLVYLFESFSRDPITLSITFLGVAIAVRQSAALRAIAAGIILYLVYVVSIGGDFMTGRFLTAPLLAAAVILARTRMSHVETAVAAAVIVGLGAFSLPATVLSGAKYFDQAMYPSGINDERGFMFPGRGLITTTRDFFAQPEWPDVDGIKAVNVQCGLLGAAALYAGPGTHEIDSCALGDPLLSRLPAKQDSGWRIGHFERTIPSGYEQSFLKNENLLADPAMRDYWEVIRAATRGPLFSLKRLKAILRLNLGLVKKPISGT
jgi:arabinofuranosyltransferase